jgi:hypothetical protein
LFLAPQLGLAPRPCHGGNQATEIVLQHIVHGTVPQRLDGVLLADGSGDEEEWQVGVGRADPRQSTPSVVLRHGEIGEDDVGFERCQLEFELLVGFHALPRSRDLVPREFSQRELDLLARILDE